MNTRLHVQAVELIYASGAAAELVPEAFEATSRLLGASGATLDVIDKVAQRPATVHSAGLPAVASSDHFNHFSALD